MNQKTADTARIAFIGAGNHATSSLYPNIAHIPEFDLICVCDLREDRARRAATDFGAHHWYTDVDTMLDEQAPEGACICGPPRMHYQVVLQVLSRGIPVFVEKPPAPTLQEASELVETARANDAWGMVGFMKRFAPANMVARDYITGSGEFGDISSITLIHGSGPYDDARRMLLFNGIHLIDLARFLAGDVKKVFASALAGDDPIAAITANLEFASGAPGQLNMNSGHSWNDCFEQVYISGVGAAVLIDASQSVEVMSQQAKFADAHNKKLYGWSSRYYVSGNMAGWEAGGHYTKGYWGELNHFARAVCGKTEPFATLEDGAAAMAVIDAIIGSIERGEPVAVEG